MWHYPGTELGSLKVRKVTDELRSEGKEKEAHLDIGNSMCKDPVAGESMVSMGEETGKLEQGKPRGKGKH